MALQTSIKNKITVNRATTLLDRSLDMLKENQVEYNGLKSNSASVDAKILSFDGMGLKLNSLSKQKRESEAKLYDFDSNSSQINKETRLMDRLIRETKGVFNDAYDVKSSFDGSSPSSDEELIEWREKYSEFESLVNDLKKKIGYPTTLNFEGGDDGENPLIPLIEEVKKMIAFMEREDLKLQVEVTPTVEVVENKEPIGVNPILIGGVLLGGYLLLK